MLHKWMKKKYCNDFAINITEEQILIVHPADEVISYTADRTPKRSQLPLSLNTDVIYIHLHSQSNALKNLEHKSKEAQSFN